ncbi:alpha beta-hydrolase [Lecanosticta acicola]|uniref:Alpha beta-hydrolase n=1 Tax=Lecanosticta acicola TaxID=111012 RepID=A0AAI9EC42_9PEZI|nr:alpha beta-hydrolase [Lecanosticta acicola]
MAPAPMILSKLGLGLAGAAGLYAVLLGVLLTPPMQRFALYAHYFNTLLRGDDLSDGETFGFAHNQVTPFNIQTSDGETLFAWHVLPLDAYARNERRIREEKRPDRRPVDDVTKSEAFKLLTDGNARVVVSWDDQEVHGNAGHLAQNFRTVTNRFMTTQPNTHVLTVDYRGFGHSTGSPTEAGLIADGIAVVDWVLNVANISPERIVILGQSLGTAVASAVALHFASPGNELIPGSSKELQPVLKADPTPKPLIFKGVILAAPFNSVPSLLLTYRIGGMLPLLLPLRPVPWLANILTAQMCDKWLTAERLTAYYHSLESSSKLRSRSGSMGALQIVHAVNDADIPYHQTEMICRRILGRRDAQSALEPREIDAKDCIDGSKGAAVLDVKKENMPRLRFELVKYGGHNRIITYSPVAVAVLRAFDDLFE